MSKLKTAAEFYFKKNWNVIPYNFGKATLEDNKVKKQVFFKFDYKKYHEEMVNSEDIKEWWGDYNAIAIVTGKISSITVMDIDTKNLAEMKDLPATFTVETNKGFHFYFKHTDVVKTNSEPFWNKDTTFNIDVRNNGGIIYAPPSEYELPNGEKVVYKIVKDLPLADFPVEWLKKIYATYDSKHTKKGAVISDWKDKAIQPMMEGSRNMDFASIVGGLLNKFPQSDWESLVWVLVQDKNKAQDKPLNATELRTIFNSIAKKEAHQRNSGGEIKDVSSTVIEDEIRVDIRLTNCTVSFKAKNLTSNLLEATVITWIEKTNGFSHEIPFGLKIKSDSNKESWSRLLSKTFDKKDEKETYPWTILVAKVSAEIEKQIQGKKQHFTQSEIVAKQATWLAEPYIQEGQINTFFGKGSSGKTLIAIQHSIKLLEKGINSLFIDYENDASSWKDKLEKMGKNNNDGLVYFDTEQIPLCEQVDKIKAVIKEHNIKLVIIDSASMATGESTSDEKYTIRLMGALKQLKTTILLIAHQKKTDGEKAPIGSVQFENQARNVWNFKHEIDENDYRIIHIACTHTKANNTYLRKDPVCYKVDYRDTEILIEEEDVSIAFEEKLSTRKRIAQFLEENQGSTYEEIASHLDITKSTANKNLSQGKKMGIFRNEDNGKWFSSLSDWA